MIYNIESTGGKKQVEDKGTEDPQLISVEEEKERGKRVGRQIKLDCIHDFVKDHVTSFLPTKFSKNTAQNHKTVPSFINSASKTNISLSKNLQSKGLTTRGGRERESWKVSFNLPLQHIQ